MTAMEADGEHWHPSYSSSNTDLVLISDDGVKFRVHSTVLAPASKFFRDMFEMPHLASENTNDALPMGESSEIIKAILDIIYPHDLDPILPSTTFTFVRRLLSTAERFELMRVNHYVRLLTTKEPFASRPLEVYALACIFGWAEEARTLSLQSLNLDLSSPAYADILTSIDSASLYSLFQLRWKRKQKVLEAVKRLEDGEFQEMWACHCDDDDEWCQETWDHLTAIVAQEMDKCPDGSGLRGQEFWGHEWLTDLWNAKCTICSGSSVDGAIVKATIIDALDEVVKEDMKWKDMK